MKKHTRVAFSLLLVVCMLISGTPIAIPAVAVGTDNHASEAVTETLPVETAATDTAVLNDDAIIVEEDTTLRGEYEKHFLMSDGSYQVALYNEPVHKMEDSKWVEIDNTLTLKTATDGTVRYATTDGLADVSFSQSFDDQLITMQQDDYSVSWGVQAFSSSLSMNTSVELVQPVQAELVTSDLSTFNLEDQKTLATKSSSTIQYRNALRQNVDLEYVVLPSRVKENIILQSAQDISYYVVTVYAENLSARLLENREIEFYNDSDDVIFTMTSPYMYDSVGELSEDITVEMVSKGTGCYYIKMTPNSQWLNDESRVYPVVIDPQVSVDTTRTNIIDNYVLEGAGVQNRNLDRLYIGNRSEGRARAFIKYDTMPTLPEGAYITGATMTLKFTNGTDTAANANAYQVTGGDWASGTIAWANMPATATALATNINHNNLTGYSFSCVKAVRYWYSRSGSTTGNYANYGVMLRYNDETVADYNAVYSADYTDESKRPALTITYTFANATEGYSYTLTAPDTSGTVTWTSSDTSIATVTSSGKVTGVKAGKVTITAAVGSTVLKTFTVYIRYADGVYYIKNLSSGYYLSAKNGGISHGTGIVQTSKASSTAAGLRQMWKIKYLYDGRYSIRPLHKLDMGLGYSSGVVLREIGTSDTYSGVGTSSRWTIGYSSNGYAIQKDGSASYTLCAANNTSGATVTTSSTSSTPIFRWIFESVGTVANQVLLYDTTTEKAVSNATRAVEMGETLTLDNLRLTAAFVSQYSIDQSITWSTRNPSIVSVNSSTGAVTGLTSGGTATIIAKHIHNGVTYENYYTIYVTEASVPVFQIKHYYDQGYNIKEGDARTAIQGYHNVVRTRFESIFGLRLMGTIELYTSQCDACKISQYGAVTEGNLDSACNHSSGCLSTANIRTDLISQKGAGDEKTTVVAWSGHGMTNEGDVSNSSYATNTVVITTSVVSDWNDTYNKNSSRIFSLLHELSHQLNADDHYCYGKGQSGRCVNPTCDECTLNYSAPRACVMSRRYDISTLTDDEMYCDDCLRIIRAHLDEHH